MPKFNESVDLYIERSADFSKPVLYHIRDLVHKTCLQAEEKIKWGFPHFDFRNEMMCNMAASKHHCAFTFWKAQLMKESKRIFVMTGKTAMGHFGQIKSLKDLPSDKLLTGAIKEALKLYEAGIKIPKIQKAGVDEINVPVFLSDALKKNKKA